VPGLRVGVQVDSTRRITLQCEVPETGKSECGTENYKIYMTNDTSLADGARTNASGYITLDPNTKKLCDTIVSKMLVGEPITDQEWEILVATNLMPRDKFEHAKEIMTIYAEARRNCDKNV
jgi:hypothetical protein